MASPSRSSSKRFRLYSATVILLTLLVIGVPAGAGFLTTYKLLYPSCDHRSDIPEHFGYTGEDVTLKHGIRAYFFPGTNGAAVIILPTGGEGRGSQLGLAAMLVQHGYAVLTYESRRCAGMGPFTLGYKEAKDVRGALDYLNTRSEINRIGIMGFSSAGAASIMAAARFPEIEAVIAEGGYGDFVGDAVRKDSSNILERIYKGSIGLSYHLLTGIELDQLSPVDVIAQIAPRPILLIYGSLELSLDGAKKELAAAGDNAELWIVEGANHGTYQQSAPQEYEKRVIAFFDHALLNEAPRTP